MMAANKPQLNFLCISVVHTDGIMPARILAAESCYGSMAEGSFEMLSVGWGF